MEAKNNNKHFVLVHGMCHGAWCWYKLATLLEQAGHRVTAPDLSASGMNHRKIEEVESFADYCQPLLDSIAAIPEEEKVVLVGHSLGGFVIALAMETFPEKVSVAVFVTAMMPSEMLSMSKTEEEDLTLAKMLLRPGSPFSSDQARNDMLSKQNYGSVNRIFIVCKQDKAIKMEFQKWMVEQNPDTEVKELEEADHMPMFSQPRELFSLLMEISKEH
ncbi:polyneuridine aldehyde esterase-like isoform X2 [Carex rostrata]